MVTTKAVRAACDANSVYPDAVRKSGDAVEVKRAYYYRMGESAEKFAASVAKALTAAGYNVTVTAEDRWAAYPKTSYFVAVVRENASA